MPTTQPPNRMPRTPDDKPQKSQSRIVRPANNSRSNASSTKSLKENLQPNDFDMGNEVQNVVAEKRAVFLNLLKRRLDSAKCVQDCWQAGQVGQAIDLLKKSQDPALTCDFLRHTIVNPGRPGHWFDLDHASSLLALVVDILLQPSSDLVHFYLYRHNGLQHI